MSQLLELPEEILVRMCSFLRPVDLANAGLSHSLLRRIALEYAMQQGVRCARRRFLELSVEYFTAALTLDPQHRSALDERAIAHFNLADRVQAVRDLQRAEELAQGAEREVMRAIHLEMRGQLQASLKCAREAVRLEPLNPRGYFELAYVLQELPFAPDNEGAIAAYTRCLELGYHRKYVACFNRGWVKEAMGDAAGAMEDYQLTLEMNPYFVQAARSLSRLKAQTDQTDWLKADIEMCERQVEEAEARGEPSSYYSHWFVRSGYDWEALDLPQRALDCFSLALAKGYPRVATVRWARAWVLDQMGRSDECLEEHRLATACDPRFTASLESSAKHRARNGDRAGAMEAWAEVKRRDSWYAAPYHMEALLCRDAADWPGALQHLKNAMDANPGAEHIETRYILAEYACNFGAHAEALEACEAMLSYYPDQPVPLKLTAHLYIRAGRIREAIALLERAIVTKPLDAVACNNLACLKFCVGEYESALALFTARSQADALDFKALCNRANVLLKMKRYDEALSDYLELSRRFPGTVREQMLSVLREDPAFLASHTNCHSMFFSRQTSFEDWMLKAGDFIVRSEEYRQLNNNEADPLPQQNEEDTSNHSSESNSSGSDSGEE